MHNKYTRKNTYFIVGNDVKSLQPKVSQQFRLKCYSSQSVCEDLRFSTPFALPLGFSMMNAQVRQTPRLVTSLWKYSRSPTSYITPRVSSGEGFNKFLIKSFAPEKMIKILRFQEYRKGVGFFRWFGGWGRNNLDSFTSIPFFHPRVRLQTEIDS